MRLTCKVAILSSKDTFKLVIVDAAFFDGKNTIIYKIRRI